MSVGIASCLAVHIDTLYLLYTNSKKYLQLFSGFHFQAQTRNYELLMNKTHLLLTELKYKVKFMISLWKTNSVSNSKQ